MTATSAASTPRLRRLDLVAVLTRWLLGGEFLYLGAVKALHPVDFLKLVRQYDVFAGPPWLNLVAAWLPWLEIVCGLLLVLGIAVRGAAITILLLLLPLTAVVLRRAMELAVAGGIPLCSVKFDCGCGAGEVFVCGKLLENLLLAVLAAWIVYRRSHTFCLRRRLFR